MSGRDLPALPAVPEEHNGTRLLKMIQTRHPSYHPAMSIADLAHSVDSEELQFKCHSTLLGYVEPQLSSIKIQAEVKETRTIRVSLFEPQDFPELADAVVNRGLSPKLPGMATVDAEYTVESTK